MADDTQTQQTIASMDEKRTNPDRSRSFQMWQIWEPQKGSEPSPRVRSTTLYAGRIIARGK